MFHQNSESNGGRGPPYLVIPIYHHLEGWIEALTGAAVAISLFLRLW